MRVIGYYEVNAKEQSMYDFAKYQANALLSDELDDRYMSFDDALTAAVEVELVSAITSGNDSHDYCFKTHVKGLGKLSIYVHTWGSSGGVGVSGYVLINSNQTIQRFFGWNGSRAGFHCEIPYVDRMFDGMAFQFWDEFIDEVKSLDKISVINYHNDLSIEDAKFWELEHEAIIRQGKGSIQRWIRSKFNQMSELNSHQPSLVVHGEYQGTPHTPTLNCVMTHALDHDYVDEQLLNRAHAANLITQDYLQRMFNI